MNWQRLWPAPAKLNLFLHVVGRRADGYHCLQTVFRFIDLADTLRFEPRSDGGIVLATPIPGVAPENDLTVRAAEALKVGAGATASSLGASIYLEKRIPMGGGLGGGSSDAATTLIALNHLWACGLSRRRLQEIGLGLGADVPIFIHGRNAFAEGIGEQFTQVDVPNEYYLLAMPPVQVPTAAIFTAPHLTRDSQEILPADWRPGIGRNDLEPVAVAMHPVIEHYLSAMRRFGDARMTGSGACCFVGFASLAEAEQACQALSQDFRVLVVKGLPAHPLLKVD